MTTAIEINEIHRKSWTRRQSIINALLAKPHLVAIVAKREAEKARYIKLAVSEAVRRERIRHQKSFECELENVAEEFASLSIVQAQRGRAKKPRGRVTDDGKTLPQIIEILVSKPESRDLSASELWPRLYAELDQLGLEPKERTARNPKKATYTYQYDSKPKSITYGRFANQVSAYRKNSR